MPTVASAPDAAAPSRPFTPEEDSALLSAVRVRGTKWTEIVGSLADRGEQYAALARFDAAQLCHRFAHLRHAQGTTAAAAAEALSEGTKARAEAALAAAPDAATPSCRKTCSRPFTAEEDSALLSAVRVRGTKWTKIVGSLVDSGEQYAALARFDAGQLSSRFGQLRRAQGTKARAEAALAPDAAAYSRPFTAEEDSALLSAVRVRGTKWTEIVGSLVDSGEQYAILARFDAGQLSNRFGQLRRAQGTRRKTCSRPFTAEEDSALLSAIRVRGTKWTKIVGSLVDSGEQYAALARFGAGQLARRFAHLRNTTEGTEAALSDWPCKRRRSQIGAPSLPTRLDRILEGEGRLPHDASHVDGNLQALEAGGVKWGQELELTLFVACACSIAPAPFCGTANLLKTLCKLRDLRDGLWPTDRAPPAFKWCSSPCWRIFEELTKRDAKKSVIYVGSTCGQKIGEARACPRSAAADDDDDVRTAATATDRVLASAKLRAAQTGYGELEVYVLAAKECLWLEWYMLYWLRNRPKKHLRNKIDPPVPKLGGGAGYVYVLVGRDETKGEPLKPPLTRAEEKARADAAEAKCRAAEAKCRALAAQLEALSIVL
ncbi:hypothetical protein OAN61_01100, partial [bacterium]|nr:hypothetical protein [bacterium]